MKHKAMLQRYAAYLIILYVCIRSHIKKTAAYFSDLEEGGFSLTDERFEKISKTWEKEIKENKDKKIILVTHAPPYGTKLDRALGEHCGNKSIAKFIKNNKVELAISGHFHENFGKRDKIGSTKLINPGPYGRLYKI